jgi:hypothetical protein
MLDWVHAQEWTPPKLSQHRRERSNTCKAYPYRTDTYESSCQLW